MSTWYDVFAVSFYKLSQTDIATMEEEIERKCGPLHDGEVVDAVRSLAEEVRKGQRGAKFIPRVGHIESMIIRNRFLKSRPPTELKQRPMQEKLAVLKNAILRATDHAARWEIICDGIHGNEIRTQHECEVFNPLLEAFTIERFPDFKRPVLRSFASIVGRVAADKQMPPAEENKPTAEVRRKLHSLDFEQKAVVKMVEHMEPQHAEEEVPF